MNNKDPCTIAAGVPGCLQCAQRKKKRCDVTPVEGWSSADCTLGLDHDAKSTLERGLVHRGFCIERRRAEDGILEELQRLPRALRVAWEVFSGTPFLDTEGVAYEPRIPIEVLPSDIADVVEDDAPPAPANPVPVVIPPVPDEVVLEETEAQILAQVMEESRKDAEKQRDLETQSAGAGGSGSGATSSIPAEQHAPVAPVTGKPYIG